MLSEDMAGVLPVATLGVLADTHIPDRMLNLHPEIVPTFIAARVDLILHAGDICLPSVIRELEEIAPVRAVRGNRDLFYGGIHRTERMEIAGVSVSLMHGHGNILQYALQKMRFLLYGYRLEHYLPSLMDTLKNARVIIFGHTHKPVCQNHKNILLFNPGSAGMGWKDEIPPSIGILRFYANQTVEGEIVYLKAGYKINRKWHEVKFP